jgi:hypothetical protein
VCGVLGVAPADACAPAPPRPLNAMLSDFWGGSHKEGPGRWPLLFENLGIYFSPPMFASLPQ